MAEFDLRPHQVKSLSFYMSQPRCADLSDPGTGKTPPVCVYMYYLWTSEGCKTVWMMPKSLLKKNKVELLRFTDFKADECIIVDGTPKEREEQIKSPNAKVLLMGFKRWTDDWKKIMEVHPKINFVCGDEWHMGGFKTPTSKASMELMKYMRRIKYFLPMSGSLIDGRLDSAYMAIHIIEPRYYFNHGAFLAQHAFMDDYGSVLGWTNHEKIGRIFLRHCVRHPFNDVYGKQEIVWIKERVAMDSKSRAAYEEFEEKALLELEDRFLEGPNEAVNAMRCRQIMGHPHAFKLLKDNELTGKEEALQLHAINHLNKGTPFVVFSSLQPEQERLSKLLTSWGLRVGLINGNISPADRAEVDERFRRGELDCIVGSPATASVGFNWEHVDHVIFVSVDYQDTNFSQAFKRMIRGKRKTALLITVLEYENSIDKRIFQIVDRKSRDANKVDPTYEVLELSKI